MVKKPEELKKGLHICGSDELCEESNECPYYNNERCMSAMMADADTYILTLEADKAKLQAQNAELLQKVKQLEKEWGAAVACIPRGCGYCKWYELSFNGCTPDHDCKNPKKCINISGINTGWEWRGVPEGD